MKIYEYGSWTRVWTQYRPDRFYRGHLVRQSPEIYQYADEQQVVDILVCHAHMMHGITFWKNYETV